MDLEKLAAAMGPLREKMAAADAERERAVLHGSAGGGAVKIELGGDLRCRKVTIAPAAMAAADGDIGMLEDLIAVAVSDALRQYVQRFGGSSGDQMQKMMQGADLASLMGMLGGLGGR